MSINTAYENIFFNQVKKDFKEIDKLYSLKIY